MHKNYSKTIIKFYVDFLKKVEKTLDFSVYEMYNNIIQNEERS